MIVPARRIARLMATRRAEARVKHLCYTPEDVRTAGGEGERDGLVSPPY